MIAGRIKCDFCSFIGEMTAEPLNKGIVKVPGGWISIHPHVVVHGIRGGKISDALRKRRSDIKDKVLKKVETVHCCPTCVTERDVFEMGLPMLAAAPEKVKENYMRRDQA